jgi:hypothetical protein
LGDLGTACGWIRRRYEAAEEHHSEQRENRRERAAPNTQKLYGSIVHEIPLPPRTTLSESKLRQRCRRKQHNKFQMQGDYLRRSIADL